MDYDKMDYKKLVKAQVGKMIRSELIERQISELEQMIMEAKKLEQMQSDFQRLAKKYENEFSPFTIMSILRGEVPENVVISSEQELKDYISESTAYIKYLKWKIRSWKRKLYAIRRSFSAVNMEFSNLSRAAKRARAEALNLQAAPKEELSWDISDTSTLKGRLTDRAVQDIKYENMVKDNPLFQPVFNIVNRRVDELFKRLMESGVNAHSIRPLKNKLRKMIYMQIYENLSKDEELLQLLAIETEHDIQFNREIPLISELLNEEQIRAIEKAVNGFFTVARLMQFSLLLTAKDGMQWARAVAALEGQVEALAEGKQRNKIEHKSPEWYIIKAKEYRRIEGANATMKGFSKYVGEKSRNNIYDVLQRKRINGKSIKNEVMKIIG